MKKPIKQLFISSEALVPWTSLITKCFLLNAIIQSLYSEAKFRNESQGYKKNRNTCWQRFKQHSINTAIYAVQQSEQKLSAIKSIFHTLLSFTDNYTRNIKTTLSSLHLIIIHSRSRWHTGYKCRYLVPATNQMSPFCLILINHFGMLLLALMAIFLNVFVFLK